MLENTELGGLEYILYFLYSFSLKTYGGLTFEAANQEYSPRVFTLND